jgi:hypothetical protein
MKEPKEIYFGKLELRKTGAAVEQRFRSEFPIDSHSPFVNNAAYVGITPEGETHVTVVDRSQGSEGALSDPRASVYFYSESYFAANDTMQIVRGMDSSIPIRPVIAGERV